jgi:putative CocE/NonD family hydrolase
VPSPTSHDPIWQFLQFYPDERDLLKRNDVVTFTSEPVGDPIDLVGWITAHLVITSTGPRMHVFAKLLDVEPSGAAHPIARGQVVLHSIDPAELVTVELSPLAYRIRPGHVMRLHIMCSDYPWFLVHPGTDANPWLTSDRVATEQTLVTGGSHPSYLEFMSLPHRA